MKIGLLLDDTLDSNDGVQQYVKSLARWLLKEGHDVKFLVGQSSDKSEFGNRVISLSTNIIVSGNSNILSMPIWPNIEKMKKSLDEEKFDVLHVQAPYSPLMSEIILNLANTPKVATFHIFSTNPVYCYGSKILAFFPKKSLSSIRFISISVASKKFAKNFFGVDSIVIPPAINLKKNDGKMIKKYLDGKINILFFGRLVKRKGVIYLLRAYKKLITRIGKNSLRIIIAGEGKEKTWLKIYAKMFNLPNVEFTGYIEENDKAAYYNTSDICVFTATHGESFGIVLLEAMACGKPVVAFANAGYKEVLTGEGAKFLAEPKNVDELAERLEILIKDKKLRERMGKWGLEEVKKYDWNVVGKKILEFYEKVLKGE